MFLLGDKYFTWYIRSWALYTYIYIYSFRGDKSKVYLANYNADFRNSNEGGALKNCARVALEYQSEYL